MRSMLDLRLHFTSPFYPLTGPNVDTIYTVSPRQGLVRLKAEGGLYRECTNGGSHVSYVYTAHMGRGLYASAASHWLFICFMKTLNC